MEKILDLIENRWSPRAFNEKAIETAKLKRLFEAARLAPSASNEQPWRFLVGVKGKDETYPKLFDTLKEFNQKWAIHAPVIAVVIAKTESERTGKANSHAVYDCGQALAFLTLQATQEGLFIHQMGGFSPDKVKTSFDIPSGYEPITAFVIGYLGNPDILSEDHKKLEYKKGLRKELNALVFKAWEQPADL